MQDITISQCSPSCLWNSTCPSGAGCSPWLAFYPGRSQRAAVSAKDQVLSVQLGEKQKGGDGISHFEPGVHLSVFFRLLG